jgi:hypothetical protein
VISSSSTTSYISLFILIQLLYGLILVLSSGNTFIVTSVYNLSQEILANLNDKSFLFSSISDKLNICLYIFGFVFHTSISFADLYFHAINENLELFAFEYFSMYLANDINALFFD